MAEPKPKLKRSNKRTEVLEVACRCIANFGLQRTNAQLIASEMGVSQTTIFYYFPRQQDLFDSLFDYVIAAGRSYSEARISKSSTFKGRLTSYFHSQLDWAMACPQHIAVLFFAILDSRQNDVVGSRVRVALQQGEESVFLMISGGIVEGEFPKPKDARSAAHLLHKTLIGFILDQYLNPDQAKSCNYGSRIEFLIDLLLPANEAQKKAGKK